ncbi:MAG: uroporphyrinogen-III synthase, partial [Candidatus Baltobacteraceae bacterium]
IVPGITSALAAPAYAGIPITHRNHNTSFVVATGHEDPTKSTSSLDFAKLANPSQTLVFLMAMANLAQIVARLREHGLADDLPVAIIREGTKPQQATLIGTLATIVDDVARERFAAPAIVVIGNVVRERIPWFEEGPLFGKRVLVTRPAGGADAFVAALWEAGAEPVCAPAIAFEPPDDERAADEGVRYVRAYAWVVFTSANGVRAFFERLARQGGDGRRLGDVRIAAIGPKTAAALEPVGLRADFVASAYVAETLAAELFAGTRAGDRILLYRAQEARDVLPQTLRERGRSVDVVAAYKTVHTRDPEFAAAAAATDVWTFTSASTVAGFMANVPNATALREGKIVGCIGPVAAEAARAAGLAPDVVADEYTSEGLLRALELVPAG